MPLDNGNHFAPLGELPMRRQCLLAISLFLVPSWAFPSQSPSVPAIVDQGRPPLVAPCGNCHSTSGLGRPGTSTLAGLPAEYLAHQIADFQRRFRNSTDEKIRAMAAIAAALDEREIAAASEFYASLTPKRWLRVVETSEKSAGGSIREVPGGTAGYVAFVPAGALTRGERLVTAGASGRTVRCANCHGADLRGTPSTPGIAGRSPSYLARQLNDMRSGSRHGSGSDRMMATIARLTEDDVDSMAAYLASLTP
jgi:cytochrome c553